MIPKEIVDDILSRADIVEVISSYIPVVKKGNAFRAVCPFHADTNPSLNISRSKKIFKCFACGKGGNAFSFVSEYEHIPYVESIKKVASLISYDHESLHDKKSVYDKNTPLYNALNDAKEYYHYISKTNVGIKAQEYFKKREIDEKMQDFFSLGFSPDNSQLTIKTLNSKGHDILTLDKVGITHRENGMITDRFNSRVIFPIYNENKNVIGFSGRIIEGDEAKYVNTASTPIFNKSEALYNYNNAKDQARGAKYVYVCEGFMDVFALYKIGIYSSVALMGTAFTPFHAKMLRKLNVEIRLMLDGDDAGLHGMMKMISTLEKEKLSYKVVDYRDLTLDPDEILIRLGQDKLKEIAFRLISGTEFLINYYQKQIDYSSIEGKKEFLLKMTPRVKYFETKLEKEEYLKLLASKLNVSYESIIDFVRDLIKENQKPVTQIEFKNKSIAHKKHSLIMNVERELIYHMLNNKEAINDFISSKNVHFDDDVYGLIFNYILDAYEANHPVEISSLINQLSENQDSNQEIIDILLNLSLDENHFPYEKAMIDEYIDSLRKALESKKRHDASKRIVKDSKSPFEAARRLMEERK